MIKDRAVFRQELEKANSFWFTRIVEEWKKYPVEREEAGTVFLDAEIKKLSLITGPRRVGKSVLMKHLIARLINKGIKPKNILFYSLEDPYLKLYCDNLIRDSIDYWLENIASEGRKYIFFDEIHFVDEWYKWLKVAYDRHKDIKIFVSGSSSLTLQKEANTYLKGRYIYHELWPLTFRQFLRLKGKQPEKFDSTVLSSDRLLALYKEEFRQYLLVGGFPEHFESAEIKKWFEILKNSVSQKSIYEDIAATFKIRNVKILEQILLFIVANQSRILSYEKINEIARLKHEILLNYIEYLKASYLIIEVMKLAANIKEQLKSKKKFLCVDQGLRNSLLREFEVTENNEGFIIENTVGVHSYLTAVSNGRKLFYCRTNGEADFVVRGDETIVIEAKYRESITNKDIQKVLSIMKGVDCKKAYIITKNNFDVINKDGSNILLIPALIFCLFPEDFI